MATNRIIKLNLEKTAHALKTEGKSEVDIAEALTNAAGEKITRACVNRYFHANKDPIQIRTEQRTEVIQQAVQERLDTLQQLRDVNQDTLDILKKAKNAKKGGEYLALAAIQRIEKQLELQAKLLGDLPTQPTVNITLIEGQFNEFKTAVLGVMCPECQRRLVEQLRARVEQ